MVYFVGAGPGAEDLITVRGLRLLEQADQVIYAGSLVNPGLLSSCRPECRILDSACMTLEEVIAAIAAQEETGGMTVRLHTGDPSLYGAIREQIRELEKRKIAWEICPGVSSFSGAAAALGVEYTLPGISQSLIITRMAGRTAVPEKEGIAALSAHQASMAIFLSASLTGRLQEELLKGGWKPETAAAIVYKATWPDEKTVLCTVGTLHETAEREGIWRTALILIGDVLSDGGFLRSRLYDPAFTTGFRRAVSREDET